MSTVLENTRPASFRGVPFRVSSDETDRGPLASTYLYVNTGRRTSKNQGVFPPRFTMQCFTHDDDGDLYEQKRDALVRVLDDGLPGELVHPYWGNAWVQPMQYKVSQRESELNKCNFSIPFEVVSKNSADPNNSKDATSVAIRKLADSAYDALNSASADGLRNTSGRMFESSAAIFGNIGTQLKDKVSKVADTIVKANEYADKAIQLQEQAGFYMDNPSVAFAAVTDNILGVDGLTDKTIAKFFVLKRMFNFGDTDSDSNVNAVSPFRIDPSPQTAEETQIKLNAETIKKNTQAAATIEAFAQIGKTLFKESDEVKNIVEDVESIKTSLEEQFKKIAFLLNEPQDRNIFTRALETPDYGEAYDAIKDLRDTVYTYIDEQLVSAPYIQEVYVPGWPASVLAHQLYEDSTRAQEIMSLNGLTDNLYLEGTIKVYSE